MLLFIPVPSGETRKKVYAPISKYALIKFLQVGLKTRAYGINIGGSSIGAQGVLAFYPVRGIGRGLGTRLKGHVPPPPFGQSLIQTMRKFPVITVVDLLQLLTPPVGVNRAALLSIIQYGG